ncbi:MAG: hypothetical protein CMO26_19155 [Thiotrichales bacterium]|nr:hypothetical protein [Thiotrichales bacterium]
MSGIVSVLNPKVLLCFLAFIPQCVNIRQGDVATQMLFLGAVYVGLAGGARVWLGSKLACSAMPLALSTSVLAWVHCLPNGVELEASENATASL